MVKTRLLRICILLVTLQTVSGIMVQCMPFWLYAFERMNGILGSFQTNNRDVTIQLMRKFLGMQVVSLDQWPEDIRSEFFATISQVLQRKWITVRNKFFTGLLCTKAFTPSFRKSISRSRDTQN